MKHEERIKKLHEIKKDLFIYDAGKLLSESHKDNNVSSKEHQEFWELFQKKCMEFYPNGVPEEDQSAFKLLCWNSAFKEEVKKEAKKQTLREQLQGQIEVNKLRDMGEPLKVETLWGLICHFHPKETKGYNLDDPYDDNLFGVMAETCVSIALHNQKTAHLRV